MASPTFPIRLDSTETQVNVPNPVIPRSPVQPGFSIRFNQNLIEQMSAPFPYVISLAQITQSGASVNQVPVWNGSQWVPITLVGGGINSLNGLTALVQSFATGTAGTDFGISSVGSVHTFNIPDASSVNRGLLTSTDWTTFNSKQNALTFGNIGSLAAALSITGGTGAVIGSGVNIGFAGTNLQYVRGDGSLATFPTVLPTTWGSITGTLSDQTDLQTALNGKFNNPTGTISQYIRGDGSLATFPTSLPPSGAAGGDLSGTYPNPSVVWTNGNTTYDARYFRNGGNAFGGAASIGLTDFQQLNILTNNIARIQIGNDGGVGIGGVPTTNIALNTFGVNTASSAFSFAANNSTGGRILSVRNDGEVIFGPTGFGGSIRPVTAAGAISLSAGMVLNFQKRQTGGQAAADFLFNSVAVTAVDSDNQGMMLISPSFTNASFNRAYAILRLGGTVVTNGTNTVWGLRVNPTVTNGDFRAIEVESGRVIFNGSQDWARRNITANRTLDSTDSIVNVDATSGNITITLPTLTATVSRVYIIKRIDTSTNTVTISGTIDGVLNYSLFGSMSVWLEWDNVGATWRTI